jgi:hypothetical protein
MSNLPAHCHTNSRKLRRVYLAFAVQMIQNNFVALDRAARQYRLSQDTLRLTRCDITCLHLAPQNSHYLARSLLASIVCLKTPTT